MIARSLAFLVFAATLAAQTAAPKPDPGADFLGRLSGALESITRRVSPSVVQIFVAGYGISRETAQDTSVLARERGSGSGVIIDADGYILTNAHVVESAETIRVQLAQVADHPGDRMHSHPPVPATLIGIDRETDLAVIKVDAKDLPTLAVGDSSAVNPGEIVLAVGSPLGLRNSVTMGVVSAVARRLSPDDAMAYLQTDAPINPGNSGGALVDARGRLVGINSSIFTQSGGSEGIGFAIPSNVALDVYRQLRKFGRVRRVELGVIGQSITPTLAAGLGLSRDWGVVLADVTPKTAAADAGLKIGDILTELNGRPLENSGEMKMQLFRRAPGQVVSMKVLRGREPLDIQLTLRERPDEMGKMLDLAKPSEQIVQRLGLVCVPLTKDNLDLLPPIRIEYGLLVAGRLAESPLPKDTIQIGDIIHSVNGEPVTTLDAARKLIDALKPGAPLVLHIERAGKLVYFATELN